MTHIRSAIAGILTLLAASAASAQQFPTVPSGTVIGRTQIGVGPAQAIPFAQLLALMLSGPLNVPSVNTNSIVYKGSSSGQATVSAQAVAGTPTIKWPTTSGTVADNATAPIVLDAVTGNISCPTCAISGGTFVVASRAAAAALDLHIYSTIQTLGYATPGDGGGATYKNIGTSAFIDTYITQATIAGGSAYTNNSYLGAAFIGGTGKICNAAVTVTGGAVTAVLPSMYCVGYAVGDVLTTPNSFIGGTGSGFTWTVTNISTPMASFTDNIGTHFQYIQDRATTSALQFGCVADWNGSDITATNNSPCLWSMLAWASTYNSPASGAGGEGGYVVIPKGAYMTCGAWNNTGFNIPIPQSVRVSGASVFGTELIECAADTNATNYIELCDASSSVGQFGCKIENIGIYGFQVTDAATSTATLYSNSGQQFALAENVEIQTRNRGCVKYEVGRGGAANDIWIGIDCTQNSPVLPAFLFNASSAQHILERSVCALVIPGGATNCIANIGGQLIASGIDIEGYGTGLLQQVTVAGRISSYKNIQESGGGCSQAILLNTGNLPNNILIENLSTGCAVTVFNVPSGVNTTGNILKQVLCPGAGACN